MVKYVVNVLNVYTKKVLYLLERMKMKDDYLTVEETDALIKATLDGDQYAFEKLVNGYIGLVTSIAKEYLTNWEDIQEVIQDVFLEVWKYINTYNPDKGLFSTWIGRIARNISLKYYRGRVLEASNDIAYHLHLAMQSNCDGCSSDHVPKDDSEMNKIQRAKDILRKCLVNKVINDKDYQILMFKYIYSYTNEEIMNALLLNDIKYIRRMIIKAEDKIIKHIKETK